MRFCLPAEEAGWGKQAGIFIKSLYIRRYIAYLTTEVNGITALSAIKRTV